MDAPYDEKWYENIMNQKRWDTITVTVDANNKMTTYVNGIEVQRCTNDSFAGIFLALNSAKNNYLGSSYWNLADDFIGAIDNVGIYNIALSAEEVKTLASESPNGDEVGGE